MAGLVLPVFIILPPPVGRHRTLTLASTKPMRTQQPVMGPGLAERRILPCFVRYRSTAQFAPSVGGSSRRIMTMRFPPADNRVINRRIRGPIIRFGQFSSLAQLEA